MTKINVGFELSGSIFIQDNFMGASLRGCIENNSRIFSRLDLHTLSRVTTPRREMQDPKFDWEKMAVLVFFVHGLRDRFRVHFERCLISLFNNEGFHV